MSAKEAEEHFHRFDSNSNGVVELAELQTRVTFDRNRNGEVSADEARYFLDEQEEANLETFLTLCWPRIKPFLMLDSGLFKPPAMDGEEEQHHEEEAGNEELEATPDDLDEHGLPEDGAEEEEEYEEETGEGEVKSS